MENARQMRELSRDRARINPLKRSWQRIKRRSRDKARSCLLQSRWRKLLLPWTLPRLPPLPPLPSLPSLRPQNSGQERRGPGPLAPGCRQRRPGACRLRLASQPWTYRTLGFSVSHFCFLGFWDPVKFPLSPDNIFFPRAHCAA